MGKPKRDPSVGGPIAPRCTAHRKNGDRCKRAPIKGGTVCTSHGGKAPQVRAKARERMMELVAPAMLRLEKILTNPATSDADAIRAMREVFDRAHDAGLSRTQTVDVKVDAVWDKLDDVAIVRNEGDDHAPAQIDDATRRELARHVTDWAEDQQAERMEPDGEPLDHDGHEVIRGEVVHPTGRKSSDPVPWAARSAARRR